MLRTGTILALIVVSAAVVSAQAVSGTYRLQRDSWAYRSPDSNSGKIKRVHAGKLVNVVGLKGNFAEVLLRDGETGYVPQSVVGLARRVPGAAKRANTTLIISKDSGVYARPSSSSRRVAEVHRGGYVHVIGVQSPFLKIRMKDGVVGYISASAVE